MQKVNKGAEKKLNCCTQYNSSKFNVVQEFKIFSAFFARRLFLSTLLNSFRRYCF